jgi:flagellar motor switch protein FliM
MSKILTQEEIDALLKSARRFGGSKAKAKSEPAAAAQASRYDFRRQTDTVSTDLLTAIEGIHEQFAINATSSLTMRLRSEVEISVESMRTQSYSEFIYSLSDPTNIITVSMKPLEGLAVIEFNPTIVVPTIDILLGGQGAMPNTMRPTSEIEWSIFEGVIDLMLADLQHAWTPMFPDTKFEITSRESRPSMVQAVQPQDTVITFTMKVKVGSGEGYMHLSLPTAALKPFFNKLSNNAPEQQKQNDWQMSARLSDLVRQANVNLTAELRGTVLTVDELLQLREGDILRLDQRLAVPASIAVNNLEKFTGTLGSLEGSRMISILERIA